MSEIIDEDSDSSSEFLISESSPNRSSFDFKNLIEDSSSPSKITQDDIVESYSPEVKKRKYFDFVRNIRLKRSNKKSHIKRNLLETRPPLNFTILKKDKQFSFDEAHVPGQTSTSSSSLQLPYQIKTKHKQTKVGTLETLNRPGPSRNPSSLTAIKVCPTRLKSIEDPSYSYKQQPANNYTDELGHFDYRQGTITDVMSQPFQIDDYSQEARFDLLSIQSPLIENKPITNFSESCLEMINDPCHKEKYVKEVISKANISHDESLVSISKVPKRGSLLEKAYKVISTMKKDSALFSHEINVGLRTSRGSFVSDVLIVKSIRSEDNYFLIECSPLVNYSVSLEVIDTTQPQTLSPFKMFLFTLEVPKGVKTDCKLLVHFPVLILFDVYQKTLLVFIENRTQIVHQNFSSHSFLQCGMKVDTTSNRDSWKIFRNLKSRTSKNVLDAVVGNLLMYESVLELNVLHMYYHRQKNEIIFLTLDSEQQFCMIRLTNSGKMEDTAHIQIDAVYIFVGFYLTKCLDFIGEIKNVAEYYACGHVSNKYMYIFDSYALMSRINFVKKLEPRIRNLSSISTLLLETMDEKRIKLIVRVIRYFEEKIFVGENNNLDSFELHIEPSSIEINFPSPPFFLEGIYLKNRLLHFDRFSRIENFI